MHDLLRKYGIFPKKNLDQHFLIDEEAIKKEIDAAQIKKTETILEIGPGPGTLTKELIKHAKKVIVIELDAALVNLLKNEFHESIEIINADALKIEYPPFDKCVSNIPYSISGKLTIKLGEQKKTSVLMYQKEFAKRLIALPGKKEYSKISVMAQYYFTPEYITTVPRTSYYPAPKVDSAIVRLTPRKKNPKIKDVDLFKKTVSALFMHKNQKAKKAFYHSRHMFDLGKEKAKEIGESMPDMETKVYELDIDKLAEISNYLKAKLKGD
ncbi:MAG: 16S rRNA (adenine(1518)-N(6)/adenine(1519)-N(6))-dimethyltransferase RsmA [archaeon]